MELLFPLFMIKAVISGSKPGTTFLAPPFPAETMLVSISHEPTAIVPPILSTSKQQNRESLISKLVHGEKETWTPVLLLPSRTTPSIAKGNIVLCQNEGSLSAENPEMPSGYN